MLWFLKIITSIFFQYIWIFLLFKCSGIMRNVQITQVKRNLMQNKTKTKAFAYFFHISTNVDAALEHFFGEAMMLSSPC